MVMRYFTSATLVLGALLSSCTPAAASSVRKLTTREFDKVTQLGLENTTGNWFVKFYAPWCGHCKRLAPIYEELATALQGTVNVGEVDCTQEPTLCERFQIQGYPTVYYFTKGKMYKFNGERSLEGMKAFSLDEKFKDVAGMVIPKTPNAWEKLAKAGKKTASDLKRIGSHMKNAGIIVLAIGVFIGYGLHCVANKMCSCSHVGKTPTGPAEKKKGSSKKEE